jgi:hypothetical protein
MRAHMSMLRACNRKRDSPHQGRLRVPHAASGGRFGCSGEPKPWRAVAPSEAEGKRVCSTAHKGLLDVGI